MQNVKLMVAVGAVAAISIFEGKALAQANHAHLPNPYKTTISNWGKLPDGRRWGATSGVDISPEGNIWALDRCGANTCEDSTLDPILKFDLSGKVLKKFGAGYFAQPHGMAVDSLGNVWVTDTHVTKDKKKGLQVFKFSPEGKLLMTLGKAGVSGDGPDEFGSPSDVVVAPNGDIFVADGHNDCGCPNSRIVKFNKEGKFVKAWGKRGAGPGEFDGPHALALDSQGRLYVGDRTNARIQIFTQDGKFIAAWKQFGRPSGLFIDKNDMLYVSDSESTEEKTYEYNPGFARGIRIGSVKDGKITAFIPDPDPKGHSSTAEGVAADHQGNVYGAENGPQDLKKYVKQ